MVLVGVGVARLGLGLLALGGLLLLILLVSVLLVVLLLLLGVLLILHFIALIVEGKAVDGVVIVGRGLRLLVVALGAANVDGGVGRIGRRVWIRIVGWAWNAAAAGASAAIVAAIHSNIVIINKAGW